MRSIKTTEELVNILEKEGELIRVKDPIDVHYEITEITDRMCKTKDPKALLFTNVKGYNIPVLTNAFGSYKRLKIIFGYENLEDIGWKLYKVLRPEIPNTFLEKSQN
jgi:4-hydroxy-3-polyprenylbenzoate decarboxylase